MVFTLTDHLCRHCWRGRILVKHSSQTDEEPILFCASCEYESKKLEGTCCCNYPYGDGFLMKCHRPIPIADLPAGWERYAISGKVGAYLIQLNKGKPFA